jgi:hypothetical protein
MAKTMVTQEYTYAYAAVSPHDGMLDTLILPCVNGSCMQIFLQEVSERHAQENILMVLDGAGWHKNTGLGLLTYYLTRIRIRTVFKLPSDHDRFSKLASGVQSITVTLAVLIGGGWTAYSFWSLKSVEKARLEIELQRSKIEQARLKRPILEVDISAILADAYFSGYGARGLKAKPSRVIIVSATITNRGNFHTVLDLSSDSLFVERMDSPSGGKGRIQFSALRTSYRVSGVTADTANVALLPGAKQVLQYVVEPTTPGIYLVEFRVPAQTEAFTQYKLDAIEEGEELTDEDRKHSYAWSSAIFVNVTPDDDK